MSDPEPDAQPLSVHDILSLTTKLAERMVHTRNSGFALSMNELEAVVKAADFLHAHNVPWPAVVTGIIDSLVAQMEDIRAEAGDAEARLLLGNQPSAASSRKP